MFNHNCSSNQFFITLYCLDTFSSYPFIAYLFDMLNSRDQELIFVFLGKKAQGYEDLVDDIRHFILRASHPASAAYNKQKEWDCSDVSNKVNGILESREWPKIVW